LLPITSATRFSAWAGAANARNIAAALAIAISLGSQTFIEFPAAKIGIQPVSYWARARRFMP
jgi:hypothetical protein